MFVGDGMNLKTILKSVHIRAIVSAMILLVITLVIFELAWLGYLQIILRSPLFYLLFVIPYSFITFLLNKASELIHSVLIGFEIGILAGVIYYISVWVYFIILQLQNPEEHVTGDLIGRSISTIFYTIFMIIYSIIGMFISYLIRKSITKKRQS